MRFKGKNYELVETIETQLSSDYVPDWTLFTAIRESVQNMVDEHILSGTKIFWTRNDEDVYFYDRGRGVSFEDILYLGISGKRGLENVVGQHGEGEIVSFLVAARLGVRKVMASLDWLAEGELRRKDQHELLVIKKYQTKTPRKGTCWYYSEGREEFREAKSSFIQTRKGRRKRILRDEPGQLYTRGMKVNKLEDLALGYDLDITPGRDRGGFTWEQIEDEVAKILKEHAKPEDIAAIIRYATNYWRPKELMLEIDFDQETLQRSAKKLPKIVWSVSGRSSEIADATEQGYKVVQSWKAPAQWVQDGLKSATEVTHEHVTEAKDLPRNLQEIVDLIAECLDEKLRVKYDNEMKAVAISAKGTIILHKGKVKQTTFQDFLGTLVHELAHIKYGCGDCTRAFEAALEKIFTELVVKVCRPEVAELMRKAEKKFNQYVDI